MWRILKGLRRSGVVGINERNIRYVNALNPRKLLVRVNDKVITKELAATAKIPTPELYGVIADARDMRGLDAMIDRPDGFVVKPANGSQGKGILVVDKPLRGGWSLASGRRVSTDFLKFHINNILSGMYSLGGQPDRAMIEYRVKFDQVFSDISFKGVPDIRVIVLKGVPIFSMLRLPTAASDGKANLHRGGVGVGVNIVNGFTTQAMQYDTPLDHHPDTAFPLDGIEVPYWEEILMMAARSYEVTGLGYIGVDVVLDRDRGPLLLELNARPGISIQIANRSGLRSLLTAASERADEAKTDEERVALAKELHGGDAASSPPSEPNPLNARQKALMKAAE